MRLVVFVLFGTLAASAQDAKEAALGAQLAREVRQRTTAIENPAVQSYIDQLGSKLGAELPEANRVYTFALIAEDPGGTHEPLSLPGGSIFVSAELLRSAASEAELAGMLAHAMAHVTLPRPKFENATIPIIFIGGWQGLDCCLLAPGAPKTQRDNETRADALAVRAMSASGYDPEALTAYIARVQLTSKTPGPRTLQDRDTRIAALRQAIAELPARTYSSSDPEVFDRMQEQVKSTVPTNVPPAKEPSRPTLRRQN